MEKVLSYKALPEDLWRTFAAKESGTPTETSGHLVLIGAGGSAALQSVLTRFEGEVRAQGAEVLSGSWRPSLRRPFGGLLELAERLLAHCLAEHEDVVSRYGAVLVSLLPGWAQADLLRQFSRYRSGLADFALHGTAHSFNDFFRRREVSQGVSVALVRFILDGAAAIARKTGHPTVLCLERADLADHLTARTLRRLGLYARELPVVPLLFLASEASLDPLGAGEWTVSRAVVEINDFAEGETLQYEVERGAIAAASVFARPFGLEAWSKLVHEGFRAGLPAAAERLLGDGALLPLPGKQLAFARPGHRDSMEESLSDSERTTYHCRALQTSEADDPFVATWHASLGALGPQAEASGRLALEHAWGSSAYEPALALAEVALSRDSSNRPSQPSLALALLHYEASTYQQADRLFAAALTDPSLDSEGRAAIEHMMGYNAVFGLQDYARAEELLKKVEAAYTASGKSQEAAFVRNSIAFACFRKTDFAHAVEIEETTLAELHSEALSNPFLIGILQLNLGRLYRTEGLLELARQRIQNGLAALGVEANPYVVVLFLASLGQLHQQCGDSRASLAVYRNLLELVRDLDLDNTDQVLLQLLARPLGLEPDDRLSRSDELLRLLYLNLSARCDELGLFTAAQHYAAGASLAARLLASPPRELHPIQRSPAPGGGWVAAASETDPTPLAPELVNLSAWLQVSQPGDNLTARLGEALVVGKSVAIVQPPTGGEPASLATAVVLFSPRETDMASRLLSEIGGLHAKRVRTAVAIPEALGLFEPGIEPVPLIFQEYTLKSSCRAAFRALEPIRGRLQVLSSEFDSFLHGVTVDCHGKTGIGVLAVIPYHLHGSDLAVGPREALGTFLVSSLDLLVFDGQLIEKLLGARAALNLLPFRPFLSRRAVILPDPRSPGYVTIVVRGWVQRRRLRLNAQLLSVLERCNGETTVEELVRGIGGAADEEEVTSRLCLFLRELWRQGAVTFRPPPFVQRPLSTAGSYSVTP